MRSLRLLSLAIALLTSACSDSETTPPDDTELSPDADACEHLEGGPFADVTAGAAIADSGVVNESHTVYTIALIDDGMGSFSGIVSFEMDEAAELLLYTDVAIPLAIEDSRGDAVALEESCSSGVCSPDCDAVGGRHVVDIAFVGTYYLTLGPTQAAELRLVHFESEGHDHDE
jgi:hypothetical protein